MGEDDERHARLGRDGFEKVLEGVQAPGRGANADDGEWRAGRHDADPNFYGRALWRQGSKILAR
jgi:hypothetical protein